MDMTIDKEVSEYLKTQNVNYQVNYHVDCSNDTEWPHDMFGISFNGISMCEFKTGLGLRESSLKNNSELKKITGLSRVCYSTDGKIRTKTGTFQAVALVPTQASVLCSLLLDASANDMSFNDWCDEYRYNSDSMKDFNFYQLCCETANKLRLVFNRKQLKYLNELLSEY